MINFIVWIVIRHYVKGDLKLVVFHKVIVIDDNYDDDFHVGDLLLVMNSYMQIGDNFGGEFMYEKCWCLCW